MAVKRGVLVKVTLFWGVKKDTGLCVIGAVTEKEKERVHKVGTILQESPDINSNHLGFMVTKIVKDGLKKKKVEKHESDIVTTAFFRKYARGKIFYEDLISSDEIESLAKIIGMEYKFRDADVIKARELGYLTACLEKIIK